jgi:hypothetical protein
MVMERAPKNVALMKGSVASSDWGPRREAMGGAQPGAERR